MIEKNGCGFGALLQAEEEQQFFVAGRYMTAAGLVQLVQVRGSCGEVTGWQVWEEAKKLDFKTKIEAKGHIARAYNVRV